jgi:hypothetical protein
MVVALAVVIVCLGILGVIAPFKVFGFWGGVAITVTLVCFGSFGPMVMPVVLAAAISMIVNFAIMVKAYGFGGTCIINGVAFVCGFIMAALNAGGVA